MTLKWEHAASDYPGDQEADSELESHAYWSLGPDDDDHWGVELIVRDDSLEEIPAAGVHLGHFATEKAAKDAAERYESSRHD